MRNKCCECMLWLALLLFLSLHLEHFTDESMTRTHWRQCILISYCSTCLFCLIYSKHTHSNIATHMHLWDVPFVCKIFPRLLRACAAEWGCVSNVVNVCSGCCYSYRFIWNIYARIHDTPKLTFSILVTWPLLEVIFPFMVNGPLSLELNKIMKKTFH